MNKVTITLTALVVITLAEEVDSEIDGCSKDIIAYYNFDYSCRDVCYGNNAIQEGSIGFSRGIRSRRGAYFYKDILRVPNLNGYTWGSQFSVSLWFSNSDTSRYLLGLINNGYNGSWGIRLTQNMSDSKKYHIGAYIMTANSSGNWSDLGITYYYHWHHVVMTYDGQTVKIYLDNRLVKSDSQCCHGDVMLTHTDVVIGQARDTNDKDTYFYGTMDEVMLLKKALTAEQVTLIYQLPSLDDKTSILSSLLSSFTLSSSILNENSCRSLHSLSSLLCKSS